MGKKIEFIFLIEENIPIILFPLSKIHDIETQIDFYFAISIKFNYIVLLYILKSIACGVNNYQKQPYMLGRQRFIDP
jgi:hypothetical protein